MIAYLEETRITARRDTGMPRRWRQDGYGTMMPSPLMVQLDGKRWHRVYTTCWGNAGTDFVKVGGRALALATGWLNRLALKEDEQAFTCASCGAPARAGHAQCDECEERYTFTDGYLSIAIGSAGRD